jgi:hypothetical protein
VQTRPPAKNRVYKMLADTNIKLASVVSDVFGKSGRRMLEALIAGARDPHQLSALALGTLRRKIPQLDVALAGQFPAHHARLIAGALELVDVLGRQIAEIDQQLQELLGPLAPQLEQLDSIPGVNASIGNSHGLFHCPSRYARHSAAEAPRATGSGPPARASASEAARQAPSREPPAQLAAQAL